jgi:CubicO group peptidase (beta-lactamase class C family)
MRWMMTLWLAGCTGKADDSAISGETGGEDTPVEVDTAYDDLSAVLESVQDRWSLPSAVAAVMKGDDIVAMGAVGVRKAGDSAEVTVDDRYHLGSCTKAMTATLVGAMVQEESIWWDAPIKDLFPDVDIHEGYEGVTLSMLLLHTSGAWSDLSAHPDEWAALWEDGDPVAQRAQLAEQMLSQPPEYTPGDSWAYSNAGYIVAGAALEAVTGQSWEDLIEEKVFSPLQMTSCGFGPPDDGSLSAPWGHDAKGTPVDPTSLYADNPPALGPAGTVHCNLADWGRFAAAHLDGAQGESDWLDETVFLRMHSVGAQSYAMGWVVTDRSWAGGAAFSHAGSNTTFYSVIWLAPQLDTAWLVSTNIGDAQPATDDLLDRLIKLYGH